jgi:transposase
MLTVEDYARIRRAYRDGMSVRAIARQYHRSRRKIREVLQEAEPKGYIRRKPAPAPKLDRVKPIIDEILEADEQAPRKQRHTAAQIFRRLVAEHQYVGGYDQVRRYVAIRGRQRRETFIPLEHAPGQRGECDFGHIWVDFPEGRRQVPALLMTWAYSYCPFAIALPTERIEAILHGLVEAFAFFESVPRELWWDNPKTVATAILRGRQRQFNPRYLALASHYNFEPLCCMPARGNEKPFVENRVKNLQRRWATPVPKSEDLDDLNAYLRACCLKDRERIARVVELALVREQVHVDLIVQRVEHLQEEQPPTAGGGEAADHQLPRGLTVVEVPRPDLTLFDRFLSQGGEDDVAETERTFVAEGQLEALATADDAGRV